MYFACLSCARRRVWMMKTRIPTWTSGRLDRSIFFWCPEVRLEFQQPRGVQRSVQDLPPLMCSQVGLVLICAEPREGQERIFWSPRLMGGLAGGRVRSRNSRGIPKKKSCSLNTGLPGSRVIQAQGKSSSRRLVKNWCKWVRKMKISQNLCVQLTADQFSYLRQVKAYPGMHSLCLSIRFRESLLADRFGHASETSRFS